MTQLSSLKWSKNALMSTLKRLNTGEWFDVVEKLLQCVRSRKNSQVVLEMFNGETFVHSFAISEMTNPSSDLPMLSVIILNCHAISSQILKTLCSCILECWYCFHTEVPSSNRQGRWTLTYVSVSLIIDISTAQGRHEYHGATCMQT